MAKWGRWAWRVARLVSGKTQAIFVRNGSFRGCPEVEIGYTTLYVLRFLSTVRVRQYASSANYYG
jgi:hypothetical protein